MILVPLTHCLLKKIVLFSISKQACDLFYRSNLAPTHSLEQVPAPGGTCNVV